MGLVYSEMLGAGVETQKNKNNLVPLFKKAKNKISSAQEVGTCYSITGTRFPYCTSFSTI